MTIEIALPFIVLECIAMGFMFGKIHERIKWNMILNTKNPKTLEHVKTMDKANNP